MLVVVLATLAGTGIAGGLAPPTDEIARCGEINEPTVPTDKVVTLTENVTTDQGSCIEVAADDVVLDANGSEIGADDAATAIRITGNNVTVRNSTVTAHRGTGMVVSGRNATVRDTEITLRTGSGGLRGIDVSGRRFTARNLNVTVGDAYFGFGVRLGGNDASVTNLTVVSSLTGVDITGSNVTLADSVVTVDKFESDPTAIRIAGTKGGTANVTVSNATVRTDSTGIAVEGSSELVGEGDVRTKSVADVTVRDTTVTAEPGDKNTRGLTATRASGVRVRNVSVTDTHAPVVFQGVSDGILRGIDARNNNASGDGTPGVINVTGVTDERFVPGRNSTNVTVADTVLVDNNRTGIVLGALGRQNTLGGGVNRSLVTNNTITGSPVGIAVGASDSAVEGNTVERHSSNGIELTGAAAVAVADNVVTGIGSAAGLSLQGPTRDSVLQNNTVRNSRFGVEATEVTRSVGLSGNVRAFRPRNNTVRNTTAQGNEWVADIGINATDNEFGDLLKQSVTDSELRFEANGVRVRDNTTVGTAAPAPDGQRNVSVYFDAEDTASSEAYLNLTLQYTPSVVDGLNESALRLYDLNESTGEWERVDPDGSDTIVDVVNSSITVNITSFSTFGAFAPPAVTVTPTPTPTPTPASNPGGGSSGDGSDSDDPPRSDTATATATPTPTVTAAVAPTPTTTVMATDTATATGTTTATATPAVASTASTDRESVSLFGVPLLPTAVVGGLVSGGVILMLIFRPELLGASGVGAEVLATTGLAKYIPDPEQPAFVVEDLTVADPAVPGETIRVEATIRNIGDLQGSREVSLELDGVVQTTVPLELSPRSSEVIELAGTVPSEASTCPLVVDTEDEREEIHTDIDPDTSEQDTDR